MGEPDKAFTEGMELHRIADILDQRVPKPPPAPRADEPPPRAFLSGRWHRRDGTVYVRVAEVGSPNAGNLERNPGPRRI